MKSEYQFLCLLYASLYPDDPFENVIKFADFWKDMVRKDNFLKIEYNNWKLTKEYNEELC